jgi:hypothetical protein
MIGALRFPAYGITQKLGEFRQLTRCRSSRRDFYQIAGPTEWAKVLLAAVLGESRYQQRMPLRSQKKYRQQRLLLGSSPLQKRTLKKASITNPKR